MSIEEARAYGKSAKTTVAFQLVLLLIFCNVFFSCTFLNVYGEDSNGDVIVYVTETGSKYHREGCTYLESCYWMTLEEAYYDGYEACSRCHPPIYGYPQPTDEDPYNKPAENYSSGNNSSSSSSSYGSSSISTKSSSSAGNNNSSDDEEGSGLLIPGLLTGIALVGGGTFINGRVQDNKRRKKEEEDRANFIELLGGQTIREAAGVPEKVYFFEGLPKDNNNKKYGSYTKYLSKSGNCYHDKQGCCSAKYPTHAFRVAYRYKPCSKCCKSRVIIPDWYSKYEQLEKEASRLGVDKDINVSHEPRRHQVMGQLNVVQKTPETKPAPQSRQGSVAAKATPASQSRSAFAAPKTKPSPSLQQDRKELPATSPVTTVEIPERKTTLRMVSFDINSNGQVEGKLDGKPVIFNSVWGKHTFTEEEIIRLLNNQAITFQYTTKKGKTRTATGKLGYGTGKYANHFGFQPEDF